MIRGSVGFVIFIIIICLHDEHRLWNSLYNFIYDAADIRVVIRRIKQVL